ncbi:MAG: amylo-alpha-1,6-glucosidase, partial [Methylibium sp.]|nr:amylo-alpha-1,6-glucosidase [Methylibium sp.]
PVLYPVACSPQAWAAAALFSLLQSCLGLDVDAVRGKVSLHSPRLPPFIDWVRVHRLQVGDSNVDLLMQRYANNVGVEATRKVGNVEVTVVI